MPISSGQWHSFTCNRLLVLLVVIAVNELAIAITSYGFIGSLIIPKTKFRL